MTPSPTRFLAPIAIVSMSLCGQALDKNNLDAQTGILYGPKHAYSLTAPNGWVLDNKVWASEGIHAVFYPQGSSPKGTRIAYTRFFASHKNGAEGRAADDIAEFKTNNPSAKVQTHPSVTIKSGLKAIIRSTRTDGVSNAEWLAYIEVPTGTIFIALVTKKPDELFLVRPIFDQLVDSCLWLTEHVNMQK